MDRRIFNRSVLILVLAAGALLPASSAAAAGWPDDFVGAGSCRFLWPQDPMRPGQELIELSLKPAEADSWEEPPLSWSSLQVMDLCLPSGEVAARTRLL